MLGCTPTVAVWVGTPRKVVHVSLLWRLVATLATYGDEWTTLNGHWYLVDQRVLGVILPQGPRGRRSLVSEVTL